MPYYPNLLTVATGKLLKGIIPHQRDTVQNFHLRKDTLNGFNQYKHKLYDNFGYL